MGNTRLHANISYPDFLLGAKSQSKIIADFKTSQNPDVVTTASYRVIPFPAEAPSFPNGAHALVTDPWNAAPGNATSLKWNTGTVEPIIITPVVIMFGHTGTGRTLTPDL
ncbi:MAG: hypothetical protein R2765_08930 [Ferruginibacter sp.]